MKKIFMLMAAIALSVGAQAQIVSSRSSSTVRVGETKVVAPTENISYVRFGLDMSKPVGGDVEGDFMKAKPCYDFVYGFNNGIRGGLYWGMEWGLGSRGYKIKHSDFKLFAHNLRWTPFQVGYKYAITKDFKIDAHLGGFAAFDYAGKFSDGDESLSIWDDEVEDYNHFDAGIQLGFGIWYQNFNLDFMWQRGFAKWDKESDEFNQGLMLRLGIAF